MVGANNNAGRFFISFSRFKTRENLFPYLMQRIFETPPRRRAIASSSDSNIYLAKDPFMSGAALKSSSLPLLLQQNAATMTGINL